MVIVYAYVCGDILHYGHLRHLKSAKALGDKLIVGVLTDEAVMERKPRPTVSFRDRLEMVSALECVDLAVPQTEYAPHWNVRWVNADILVESNSHDSILLSGGQKEMEKRGGRVVTLPYYPEQSSASIKEKIKNG